MTPDTFVHAALDDHYAAQLTAGTFNWASLLPLGLALLQFLATLPTVQGNPVLLTAVNAAIAFLEAQNPPAPAPTA